MTLGGYTWYVPPSPSDATDIFNTYWGPFLKHYLVREETFGDGRIPANNKQTTYSIDPVSGELTWTGDEPGWQRTVGSQLNALEWFNITEPWYARGAEPVVDIWSREHLRLKWPSLQTVLEIRLLSEYTPEMVDGAAGGLLGAFSSEELTDGRVGTACYLKKGIQEGELARINPYGDPETSLWVGNFGSGVVVNLPDIWGFSPYGDLSAAPDSNILKGLVGPPPAFPQPFNPDFATMAGATVWHPPGIGHQFDQTFTNRQGQVEKFQSWIPVFGQYTRTTYRYDWETDNIRISAVEHQTGNGLIFTPSPPLDGGDVYITIRPGWV